MTARKTLAGGGAHGTPTPGGYVPDRGDVVWLDFDPQAGHEQAKRRPAVVLSPAAYNGRTSLALCCPVTSQSKAYPFEVALPTGGQVRVVVLADQVRSLDWRARRATYVDALPAPALAQVLARARALLT
ncbi:MAG: endoribonuclease MazF [Gemmatimonadaceae bacterium]